MPTPHVIGVDLGGTAIKLGRFDRQGNCIQDLTVPTPQPAQPQAVLNGLVDAIAQVDPTREAIAIGIGTPGPADAAGRIARIAINLPDWINVPLADWVEASCGRPTVIDNDANCAARGEHWLGAAQAFQDFLLLTLGTGVGGAIFLNGKLFVGREGTAGELGHITLYPDGPPCNSHNNGSLEQYACIRAIQRQTGLEPAELSIRAQQGDGEAIAFWSKYGRDLAAGLASLVYVLTPEAILIGGGICASSAFFFPAMQAELERRVAPISRLNLQVLKASLGNQAGMVGAARLAWDRVSE
jgi:glucokinase